MPSLAGRVAVITGAAGGIGAETARLLHRAGARVALADLSGSEAAAMALDPTGQEAFGMDVDVTRADAVEQFAASVESRFGRIDVLFNNAGVIRRKTVVDLEESEWDWVMSVNVKAVYLMSRAVIPRMKRVGAGSIVNTGSGWGLVGGPRAAAYCASKAAVVNLTRAMAIDHGPDGIRVNVVCPGDTNTSMLRQEAGEVGEALDAFLAGAADRPLQRLGQPIDIARAVLYLASDWASWVTGSVLVVDGGGLAG
ncbi:MAG: SDR family NAD(P)-dependent oxidoreductase [Clostridia bacterium]